MNYLSNNLNNSLLLPCDVMKLIFEYADPLINIREQIKNKDYDLDKIYLSKYHEQKICGLSPNQTYQIATVLNHIDNDKNIKKPKRYTLKNIYKIWVKL